MQISSENYISVLVDQIKNLTVENAQLKAHILDLEAKAKEASDGQTEESSSQSAD
ncbi:hypothetical protein lacNasYZ03_08180 [Lactobacillus nasalidis]|uniref:Transposase n=1 Tax=Lactobacillus nasalidis TaxID=2797258 RepID=A0ABQ3W6I8_9LACO|nr:hypothetical protein [Lactobacillus nasalidis]GHV97317.1 hypothetical protein lacNasYZ01_04990 [Lactobacillus nasalidis]GHV99913.1 hypothetical protein lacNasYZ02_13430 [Lactobacillus nasalidis]GHW01131.1 hypothetical protein lacNasYZ03_08180 [Lactobacillus nasalidis]